MLGTPFKKKQKLLFNLLPFAVASSSKQKFSVSAPSILESRFQMPLFVLL